MSDHVGELFIQEEIANTEINAIRKRIAGITQMSVNFHGEEFESIHQSLIKAFSEIDGI